MPSGQQRRHLLRRKRRLHAVQVSQQLYHDYTARTAQKMRCIMTSSKSWWMKAKEVMKHEAQVSSIPALKSNDGAWVLDAQGKADLFPVTFAGKCKLRRLCHNSYTVCTQCLVLQTSVVCASVEQFMAVLAGLRDDSSTGPDLLPARILKRCAEQPAKPLQSLLQRMLETKERPECWREQWVVPIYKKKVVFAASNYRGIHLTAQRTFRERSTEFELSVYWRNSDAKEYTPQWSR